MKKRKQQAISETQTGKTAATDIWDNQWQKRSRWSEKGWKLLAVFAAIGVLCVAFVWWRLFTTDPGTAAEMRADFQNYVFDLMEEYKPRFVLYDRLADPKALLQEEHWKTTTAADPQGAVQALLGEGYVIQSWEELKADKADQLWQTWFYGDQEMRGDVFIITELSIHIDKQNLPALRENTWLVTDTSGTKYILIYAEGIWGIKLLMYYQ